jgi:SNF2 family DNA or RNA helicase
MKAKIDSDAHAVLRKDVMDVPAELYQRMSVDLEPAAWEMYQKMAYELFLELKGGEISDAKNVAVKILRLQQITGGWIKSDEGNIHQVSNAKLAACADAMEDLWNADERVVVFARFKPELDAITAVGTKHRIPTYVVRGGVGREERDVARRAFQAKPGPSLFLAQIQAGGLGIPLHPAAEVLFYSVTYAYDDYKQACDRVHGPGAASTIRYQHLVARRSVDLDIYARLQMKQDLMALIMTPKGRKAMVASLAKNLGIDS